MWCYCRRRGSHSRLFQVIRRDHLQAAANFAKRDSQRHCGQILLGLSSRIHREATRATGWRLYRGMPLHVLNRQLGVLLYHSS